MSTPDAHTIFRRWIGEVWAQAHIPHDLVAEDFVGHWPDLDVHGRDGLAAVVAQTRDMFDALEFEIVLGPLTDGELLAGRWIGVGRHTGGEVRFFGNDILRVDGGRIAEYWTGTSGG
ncbi:polyketide cyclase [Mycobacterium sp. 852013-51886_SCH5428379]|uniref:ester cyclase n=1 Tax=Mycobacterium sp. 852013-51886_SCH5428379 TaxID=1834111 RepID=UPI0007FCD4A9|nr:nuclear transport factor 2 family protein [Mycobacterium sp. 852013-51886_SCH5428379]OBB59455.1 polyketide cyclase [Mycobacterium sp. 852013-51886_SCH5428379]